MKRLLICACVSISLFIAGWDSSFAQQPQYYNYNTSGSANSFPFNISAGKQVQLLYLSGDFNQPTPAPAGTITSISFMIHQNSPLGPWMYTDFTIKMGQSSITSFDSGSIYTGPLVTVYHKASVSLTGTAGQWMTITLDTPFYYDPTQSLIVDIGHCGAPEATTGFSSSFTAMTGNRRIWSVGGCPFVYSSTNTSVYHMGLTIGEADVSLAVTPSANTVIPGGDLTYTFVVSNAGPQSATNTSMSGTLPAPWTFTGGSVSQGACTLSGSPSLLNCSFGDIAAGNTATLTLVGKINAAAACPATMTFTTTATNDLTDPNPVNNTYTSSVNIICKKADGMFYVVPNKKGGAAVIYLE